MSTITKEQAKDLRNAFYCWQQDYDPVEDKEQYDMFGLGMVAMDALLASLEAEPVCVIDQSNLDYLKSGSDADVWPASRTEMGDVLLYRSAQPATVSVPEWTNEQCMEFLSIAFRHAEINGDLELDDIRLGVKMVNDSRAAMLHGAVQPQNQQQNIPENIPVNTPCKEAPEHIWLQTAGVWPESGEFSELTWCSDNQHEDDTLYVRADVVPGNSPVIPDGWVMVPVDMTPEQMRAVQLNSELGAYASANLSGAYSLFREFWDVAVKSAPNQEEK